MTTPHKWADVIKAWANGQKIQYYSSVSPVQEWQNFTLESSIPWGPWNSANEIYKWRIKPETVRSRRYLRELCNGFGSPVLKEVLILSGTSQATIRDIERLSGFIRWIDDDWQEIEV